MKNELFSLTEKRPEKKADVNSLLSTLSITVAAATVLIFSALFFTDISFSFVGTLNFSVSFFLLFFSSYVMYTSLFETGKNHGEREESYRSLSEKRAALFERFRTEGDQASLLAFCKQVSDKENRARREELLSAHLLTEQDLAAILEKPPARRTRTEKRAARALRRLRTVHLSPRALLAERPFTHMRAPLERTPEESRRRRSARFLLTAALTAALSVSVACHVLLDPSADTVAGFLLKLFALFQSGAKGFRSGFYHVTADKCDYMNEQCALLEEYFKEH